MKRASIIYGVTMKADGVSQLLSIRLDDIAVICDQAQFNQAAAYNKTA